MEYYNPENREPMRWASLAVFVYAVLLVVLMLSVNFSLSVVEPADQGIMVEFGETLDGAGLEELTATDVTATPPPAEVEPTEQQIEVDQRAEVEVEQALAESKDEVKTPPIEESPQQTDTTTHEKRVVKAEALFSGRKPQSSSNSQGAGSGTGNMGAPSGGESGAAVGGGEGDAVLASLEGRSVVGVLVKPATKKAVTGKLIMDIVVNTNGTVKSATPRFEGSTINSTELVEVARAAALKTRFTPSDNVIQAGTITYIFKMD